MEVIRRITGVNGADGGSREIDLNLLVVFTVCGRRAARPGHNRVDAMLKERGVRRSIRLRVPYFVAPATSSRETKPHRHGARALPAPLGRAVRARVVLHPSELREIAISRFWRARFHRKPGNTWLRSAGAEMFSGSRAFACVLSIASDRDELRPRVNSGGSSGRTLRASDAKLLDVAWSQDYRSKRSWQWLGDD